MSSSDPALSEGLRAALALLHRTATPYGFVASPDERANYRRVWARDGVICGLAGLRAGDDRLAEALRATLDTLAAAQGPQGQIPSNVRVGADGHVEAVSYGGLTGRVDTIPWFVLGVTHYARYTGDEAFAEHLAPVVERGLRLLEAWEFNGRGLVYVPQSGDWADEYDLHGYLLYDQILRLAALRAWDPHADQPADLDALEGLIHRTFWPSGSSDAEATYHPHALRRFLDAHGEPEHPLAALTPGGYAPRFDGFGTALALAFGVAFDDGQTARALDVGEALRRESASGLLPAFWPPVREGEPGWPALAENYRDTFSNRPGHYHNGGAWPVVTGWWALALARHGRTVETEDVLGKLIAFNRLDAEGDDWGFYEYAPFGASEPAGTRHLGWSAAALVLAHAALHHTPSPARPTLPSPASAPAARYDAVVAGELLVDLLSSAPANDLGEAATFDRFAGGSAANLAANLARLNRRVVLVGAVGCDGFGRFLQREVARTGVEARIAERPERPTTQIVVARSEGTPEFAAYRGADRLLRADQFPDALLASARLFHTTGFALSRGPARDTLIDAAHRAAAHGTTLSLDLNFAPPTERRRREAQETTKALCALAPLVKCSEDDLARLFGTDLAPDDAAARFQAWGAAVVCLTRGADGVGLWWDDERADLPAEPVEVRDVTGAGDAFWAGFLTAWLGGSGPVACARSGARMAALKLAHVGPLPERVDPALLR